MRVAALDCLAVEASLLAHVHNHAAMCVAIPRSEPQPCLNSSLSLELFPQSMYLVWTLELTMLHLQKYHWTSKTRLDREHQAKKQPDGLGTLLNRG